MSYNTANVRQLLIDAFNGEELRTFCYDYFREVYDQFTDGQTQTGRIQLLIEYAERHNRLGELLQLIQTTKSNIFAKYSGVLGLDSPPSDLASTVHRTSGVSGYEKAKTWNIPYNRNQRFTGRKELLAHILTAVTSEHAAPLIQAISGLGGIGKTQVVLEYAYLRRGAYDVVWWVRSEQQATLDSDYRYFVASGQGGA